MTRKLFLIAFAAMAMMASAQDTLRVLCIGNSFSQDAVEQNLVELAADRGVTLIVNNLYIGGCSVERHAGNIRNDVHDYVYRHVHYGYYDSRDNASIAEALAEEDYDIVTLQQASHYSGKWETYEPYLTELVDSLRKHIRPDAKIYWHMTWAYSKDSNHSHFPNYNRDQQLMYDSICACLDKVMQTGYFAGYIPGGHAVQLARQTKIGDTMCRDGFHMQIPYGRYCLACTWLEALMGKDPRKVGFTTEGVTPEQAKILRKCAHKANVMARKDMRKKYKK